MNDPGFGFFSNDSDTYTNDTADTRTFGQGEPSRPPYGGEDLTAETKKTFSRIGFSVVLLIVGMVAAQLAVNEFLWWLVPQVGSSWWADWVLSVVPLYGVGLPILLLMLKRIPVAPHNALMHTGFTSYEKPAFGVGQWVRLLFMAFGFMYIGSIIGNGLMSALSRLVGYDYNNRIADAVGESPLWATLIVTCVIAPLGEEFIFRKLLIDRARRFGDTTAILMSAILFGLFHGNLFQFFYAALLGVILSYVYTRTGNLWWCVGMHAAVNLVGGVLVPALGGFLPESEEAVLTGVQLGVTLLLMVWTYGTIIAGIVLFIKRLRWRALTPDPALRPTARVFGQALLNPGMIVLWLMLLGLLALNLIPPMPVV